MDWFKKTSKLDAAKKRLKKRRCQTVVLGDEGVGKTSLIYAFATGSLPKDGEPRLPSVMPPLLLTNQFCIVDTAINRDSRTKKSSEMEIKLVCESANFVMICYACDNQDTFGEVIGFWLPKIRSFNIKAPIAVVGCKEDLRASQQRSFNERMGANLNEFPEVELWMECSAVRGSPEDIERNIFIFNVCFRTGLFPTAPLYNRTASIQPLLAEAPRRIFDDHALVDEDGLATLTRLQIMQFEEKYFDLPLSEDEVNWLLQVSSRESAAYVRNGGLTFEGFCGYCHFITSDYGGEFLWRILRLYGYDDNLKLEHHSWLGLQMRNAKNLIFALAQKINLVTGYWLYKKALGLDAPVVTATGFDAEVLSFGSVLSCIVLGVALGVVLTVYQTVTVALTAHSLIVSNHKIIGSLTILFMILPSFVMALLWSPLRGDIAKACGWVPLFLSAAGLTTVLTDLRSQFRKLGRMSRNGRSSLCVEIGKCGFVTHVFLLLMLPAVLYVLAVVLTLFAVCFSVLTLCFFLLCLFSGVFLFVVITAFILFSVALGLFLDTYLILQVLASPCLAMEAKYASRYMNFRGLVNACSHLIPQIVVQVVLLKLNVIPRHEVVLSFVGLVVVVSYTFLVFYLRARYFCRQRGIPTSLQIYLVDDILKPLEFIPNSDEIICWCL